MPPIDLGEAFDIDVVGRLVSPIADLKLVDIGCGRGDLARALVGRGARVLGVEPNLAQAAAHRTAALVTGLRFVENRAESLPVDSGSLDGAIFGRSLHHVPIASMSAAVNEAMRVIDPEGGFLLVLEPSLAGPYTRVMLPFHNETEVRKAAQAMVLERVVPHFRLSVSFTYRTSHRFDNFASFVEDMVGSTFTPYRRADVEMPKVRALFKENRAKDGYLIQDDTRVDMFRGPKGMV
ncbi:MAG: class I SAM-dependent methyltransferase [Alphaproteobacteria bacterium]|nr:class I SAM-dependent methyltransferase [Alphaproteobacteria bacterium]